MDPPDSDELGLFETSGDNQAGVAGEPLAEPFTVTFVDDFLEAVYEVCFEIADQPGGANATFEAGGESHTDFCAEGSQATARLNLGEEVGVYVTNAWVRPSAGERDETKAVFNVTFTATAMGLDHITIQSHTGVNRTSDQVVASEADGGAQFFAAAFDETGTFIDHVNVTWALEDGEATLGSGWGRSVAFNSTRAGEVELTASRDGVEGTQVSVTVIPGPLENLKIRDDRGGEGEILALLQFDAGEDAVEGQIHKELFAAGYDSFDNFIEDAAVTWSLSGVGELNPDPGDGPTISTNFTAGETGTATVAASLPGNGDINADAEIHIEGELSTIEIHDDQGNFVEDLHFTAGDTVEFFAVGFDAFGNPISGDVQATWELEGVGASLTASGSFEPASGASTNFTAEGAGEVRIVASFGQAINSGEVDITVVHGPPVGLAFEPGSMSVTVDEPWPDFSVVVQDAFGNTVLGHPATNVSLHLQEGSLGELHGNPEAETDDGAGTDPGTASFFGVSFCCKAGMITVIATNATSAEAGTLANATIEIHVAPNVLDHLLIRDAPGELGGGVPEEAVFIAGGEGLEWFAAGYDEFSNFRENVPVTWNLDGVGHLEPDPDDGPTVSTNFTATQKGAVNVTVSHPDPGVKDVYVNVTVVPAAPDRMEVRNQPGNAGSLVADLGTLEAGDTRFLFATGFDEFNNYVGDLEVTWLIDPPALGSFDDAGTVFTAERVGEGNVTAHFDGLNDVEVDVAVVHGPPARLAFEGDPPDGLVAGEPWPAVTVLVQDFFRNHVEDDDTTQVTVRVGSGFERSLQGGLTQTAADGVVTFPDLSYRGAEAVWIVAESADLLPAADGPYEVGPAQPALFLVRTAADGEGTEAAGTVVRAGDTLTLFAAGYDAWGNHHGDLEVEWSLDDEERGRLDPTGAAVGTAFHAERVGFAAITAAHGELPDVTVSLSVEHGPLHRLGIRDGNGIGLESLSLHAAQAVDLVAVGFDAWDNPLGEQAVSWSVITKARGSVDPTQGPETAFTAGEAGIGTIRVVRDNVHASLQVEVHADPVPPQASFFATCDLLGCTFDASGATPGDAPITTHTWELGDGNTAEGVTVAHVYDKAGTYKVRLNVTDAEGLAHESMKEVTVSPPPAPDVRHIVRLEPEVPEPGDTVEIHVTIENIGNAPLLDFLVAIDLDGKRVHSEIVASLGPAESRTITAFATVVAGDYTIRIDVPGWTQQTIDLAVGGGAADADTDGGDVDGSSGSAHERDGSSDQDDVLGEHEEAPAAGVPLVVGLLVVGFWFAGRSTRRKRKTGDQDNKFT